MSNHGLYRSDDPSTSKEAGLSFDPTWLEKRVAAAIASAPKNGLTWWEIHQLTGIALASISPRFRPLRDKKIIMALRNSDGKIVKRRGPSTRKQIVWVPRT